MKHFLYLPKTADEWLIIMPNTIFIFLVSVFVVICSGTFPPNVIAIILIVIAMLNWDIAESIWHGTDILRKCK